MTDVHRNAGRIDGCGGLPAGIFPPLEVYLPKEAMQNRL